MSKADTIRITGAGLTAIIARHGAQMQALNTADGQRLIWPGDPAIWPDHALILFPVIGPLPGGVLRHADQEYSMPAHGFAHLRDFRVAELDASRVVFALDDDDATRASYPFAFQLQVSFALADGALHNTITVNNPGNEVLPADVGFHPGFNWPLTPGRPKSDYLLRFDKPEPAPIRRGTGDPILLLPDRLPSPVHGNVLRPHDSLFTDNAVVWDRLESRSVVFGAEHALAVSVAFPDSPNLAMWMRPGGTYLCIEPWQGYPAEVGFTSPFLEKPGIALLRPGETRSWRLRITPHPFDATSG